MFKIKKFAQDSLITLICTTLLILIGELSFHLLYSFSKESENYKTYSRFFENKKQYARKIHKNNVFKNPYLRNFFHEKSKKNKVAVIGGSSAVGFGSSFNFSYIASEILKEEFIIHNYAIEGLTFNDQIPIINKVEKYYDYLIIYSGHNEIWSNLYSRTILNKEKINIPKNFYKINYYKHTKNLEKKIQLLEINSNNLNQLIDKFIYHSRTYYFFEKIVFKIKRLSDTKIYKNINNNNITNKVTKKKNKNKFPLFVNKQFLTVEHRKKISENFLNKLKSIDKKK